MCSCKIPSSLVAQRVKRLPAMQETRVWSLGWEDPLEKEIATHSSILAWRIPWTEEPGGLQSTGSQRVGHDWVISLSLSCKTGDTGWKLSVRRCFKQFEERGGPELKLGCANRKGMASWYLWGFACPSYFTWTRSSSFPYPFKLSASSTVKISIRIFRYFFSIYVLPRK